MKNGNSTPTTFDDYNVEVTRYANHLQDGSWSLGVRHSTPDGLWIEDFIPFETLSDPRSLGQLLARRGFRMPVAKKERERLLQDLAAAVPEETCRVTRTLGWYGDVYVLPQQSIGGENAEEIVFDGNVNASSDGGARGTVEEWKTHVAEPAGTSSLAVFLTCSSLSAVLMRFTDVESGMFHVFGPSGVGKTTLARVAVSTWRGGAQAVDSWNATPAANEELLVQRNDGFACFDEIAVAAADTKALRALLKMTTYSFTSGATRRRSKSYAGGASAGTFKFLGLSTGEISAAEIATTAGGRRNLGEEARFIDLPVEGHGNGTFDRLPDTSEDAKMAAADIADHLNRSTTQYYGTAAPAFIEYVVENIDQIESRIAKLMDKFLGKADVSDDGWERRIARKFALAYAAGAIGIDAGVLPWSRKLVGRSALRCYQAARADVQTEDDDLRDLLRQVQTLTSSDHMLDIAAADSKFSLADVNAAKAIRRKHKKSVEYMIDSETLNCLADKPTRDKLLTLLDQAGGYVKPHGFPRIKARQTTPVAGAERRYFYVFTKALRKFALPDVSRKPASESTTCPKL